MSERWSQETLQPPGLKIKKFIRTNKLADKFQRVYKTETNYVVHTNRKQLKLWTRGDMKSVFKTKQKIIGKEG